MHTCVRCWLVKAFLENLFYGLELRSSMLYQNCGDWLHHFSHVQLLSSRLYNVLLTILVIVCYEEHLMQYVFLSYSCKTPGHWGLYWNLLRWNKPLPVVSPNFICCTAAGINCRWNEQDTLWTLPDRYSILFSFYFLPLTGPTNCFLLLFMNIFVGHVCKGF